MWEASCRRLGGPRNLCACSPLPRERQGMGVIRRGRPMHRAKNSKRTSALSVLVCFLALLSFPTASQRGFAQSSNGQITGLVTDSTGAAVEGAKVSALNNATSVTYNGTTNSAGVYVLPQLIPGSYRVSMSKEGFATV